MITIVLLKDAEASKSFVFAKVVVLTNGFELPIAVGMLPKAKDTVAKAGSIAMELPDNYLGRVQAVVGSFTVEETGEVKEYTTLKIV